MDHGTVGKLCYMGCSILVSLIDETWNNRLSALRNISFLLLKLNSGLQKGIWFVMTCRTDLVYIFVKTWSNSEMSTSAL